MSYKITDKCLTIYDCSMVSKWVYGKKLREIRYMNNRKSNVWKRSIFSLNMEWVSHSFLFSVGYKPDQTKDADLDYPCDRPEWQYIAFGMAVWLFTFKTK